MKDISIYIKKNKNKKKIKKENTLESKQKAKGYIRHQLTMQLKY